MTEDLKSHWETVYQTEADDRVSWFEAFPALSRELIAAAHDGRGSVVDIGGGASRLVDALLDLGYASIAVFDLTANALDIAKARLGTKVDQVEWVS